MNKLTNKSQQTSSHMNDAESIAESTRINGDQEESTMTDDAINYFLVEILKKKKELHDPRYRCNKFYTEIRNLLITKHGLYFNVKTLDKKFQYLKRHFDSMCQNKSEKNSMKCWKFFEKMMDIFAEELDIEDAPTMASLYPDLPLPKSALPLPYDVKEDVAEDSFSENELRHENVAQNDGNKETIWSHAVVLEFLNECVKEKDRLWNPQHRRQDIFLDIQNRMNEKGYTFRLDTLDRKLRNLKTCYNGTIESMRRRGIVRNGHHHWPYFLQLDELYSGYDKQKQANKKTGRRPGCSRRNGLRRKTNIRKPRRKIKIEHSKPHIDKKLEPEITSCHEEPTASSNDCLGSLRSDPLLEYHQPELDREEIFEEISANVRCSLSPEDLELFEQEKNESLETDEALVSRIKNDEESIEETLDIDITDDLQFAKKILDLEERRTNAMEQLLEELVESNRIRRRKLEFNKTKLAYLKARAKRKHLIEK